MSFKNGEINNRKGFGWKAICLTDSYKPLEITHTIHNGPLRSGEVTRPDQKLVSLFSKLFGKSIRLGYARKGTKSSLSPAS